MDSSGGDGTLPADLVLVALVTLLTVGVSVMPVLSESLVRIPLGVVFLFFVPGYVLTAALFPRASDATADDEDVYLGPVDRNFGALERTAVSIGLSIAIVSLLTLTIDASPWSLSLGSILVSVGGFVAVATVAAARRRRRLPPEYRLRLVSRSQLRSVRDALRVSRLKNPVNVLLAISIVLASGSVAYAATVPREDQQFTRFYILSENEEGELATAGYPVNLASDEMGQVAVGIENHEHERVNYSAVVLLQRVSRDGGSVTVVAEEQLTSYSTVLNHGETDRQRVTFSLLEPDEEHRVSFLLYRGRLPENPTPEDSYRHVHLLVNRNETSTPPGGQEATATSLRERHRE